MKIIKNLFNILFSLKEKVFKKGHLQYSGPFDNWDIARSNSVGYQSEIILEKITKSTLEVLNNIKKYERDGTSFEEKPIKNTLIDSLEDIGIVNKTIVDMGGSLGSLYLNYKSFFSNNSANYIVVEQNEVCEKGRIIASQFNLPIEFVDSINKIQNNIDIVICSSFLQYIEEWRSYVDSIISCKPEFIIVDRHPLSESDSKIYVQLNTGYYSKPTSYPLHILNKDEFLSAFQSFEILKEWSSDFDPDYFKGFLLKNSI